MVIREDIYDTDAFLELGTKLNFRSILILLMK